MTEVNKQEPLIRQARRKLAELFPDDYSVYEKWEQYKEIYASAYRSAPNNMDKIIEYWIDTISPYDHGVHHSELVFPLNVLNNTIATGYGKQHLYDIVRIIAPPQSYAIIYLLWQCNSISNDERLKRAKKDFLERGYTDEDADIIRDYDINLETLQEWRHDEPERPLSHRMFGANPTINAGASQYLKKNFPDKADSYETISKGINLYVQAYHDALEHVVDQWFLVCSKEYVQKKLLELNGLFQNQTSPEKIRSEFLPDIKASAYNVFKLLIDTYTEEKDYQADNKNISTH